MKALAWLALALGMVQNSPQSSSMLSLGIGSAAVERVCRLDDQKYLVDVRVTATYRNVGPRPIVVIPESVTLTGAEYAKDADALSSGRAEVRQRGTVVLESDPSGPWRRDQVRTLVPGETFEGALRLSVVASPGPGANESDVVLGPGRHFLRVAVLLYAGPSLPSNGPSSRFDVAHLVSDVSVVTIPDAGHFASCS